jgi:general secretion pathway protein B
MSFILEALKKSENERQRKIGPSLADVQVREPHSEKPWWAFAVAGLLLINLAVLVIVLLRNDAPPTPAANRATQAVAPANAVTPVTSPATAAPPGASASVQPERVIAPNASTPTNRTPPTATTRPDLSVRSLADEANIDMEGHAYPPEHPNLALAASVPSGPSIVRPIDSANAGSRAMGPQVQAPRSEPEEVLPTFRELGGTSANLPDLHLDIHVHSPMPAERFVFVNMRKYIEGQSLSEGPVIERITSEGVVLNHRGLRFLLPRQ